MAGRSRRQVCRASSGATEIFYFLIFFFFIFFLQNPAGQLATTWKTLHTVAVSPVYSGKKNKRLSYTQISPLRNQEIRRHVPFLNWNPHTIVVGQNA